MADRSVVVRLRGEIGDFKSKMDQASRAALQVGEAAARGNQKAARGLAEQQKAAKSSQEAWDGLANAATVTGGVMMAGFVLATRATMNFDKQMSAAKDATRATAAEMDALRQAAIEAGARTQYSATEAAAAIENLAKAGISTSAILGGALDGSLDLAAAGAMDVATAAEIAATVITQFNLQGSDMAHVADVLAAGAGKAQGDVQDLSLALQYVGTTASQMGVSLEETTGTLAFLASNGQLAEKAGTGLRGVISSMTAPSQQAKQTMDAYGISLYDAAGQFVGLDGVAGQLQARLGGLTEEQRNVALGQIFGNAQIETARILYAGGADAITEWTNKVNDQGFAAESAATKMDNLAGDVEKLSGSVESAFIKGGSGGSGALRFFVQSAEKVVDVVGAIPGPMLGASTAFLGLAGAALILAPRILAVRTSLQSMSPAAQGAAKSAAIGTAKFLALAAAAGVMNAALTTDVNDQALAKDLDEFAKSGAVAGEVAQVFGDDMSKLKGDLSFMLTPNWYDGVVKGVGQITSAFGMFSTEGDIGQQIAKVDQALAGLANSDPGAAAAAFDRIKQAANDAGIPIEELTTLFPQYTAAAGSSVSGSDSAVSSLKSVGDAAASAGDNMDAFADALEAVLAPGLALERATTAQRDGLRKLSAAVTENGSSLSAQTEKGRANREVFASMIENNRDLAIAVGRVKTAQEGAAAGTAAAKEKYDQATNALVRAGTKAGFSEREVRKFIDSMNAAASTTATPRIGADVSELRAREAEVKAKLERLGRMKPSPKVRAETAEAQRLLAETKAAIDAIQSKTVTVTVQQSTLGKLAGGASAKQVLGGARKASGGPVNGPGTSTSDSIPAWLSNGEYVIRADAVDHYGVGFFDRLNTRKFAKGGSVYTSQNAYDKALKAWEKRNDQYQKQKQRYDERISARDSAVSARQSGIESVRSSYRQSSGVMTFDLAAYGQAQAARASAVKEETAALEALFDARRKANTASREDRPAALRELADAQKRYAAASREAADAAEAEAKAKPTARNILTNMRDRVTKMQGFAGNLAQLQAWGFPPILLSEILGSGLESGSEMAAALVQGGPGDIGAWQALATQQTNLGTQFGVWEAAWAPGEGDKTADQVVAESNAAIPAAPAGPGKKPKLKKAKKRATGGPVTAGEPYLVGETGMEMFIPGQSGTIVSAGVLQSAAMLPSGQQSDVTMSAPVVLRIDGATLWTGIVTANQRSGFTMRQTVGV